MNKEYILKVLFAVGLLFVLFLWSGGIYKYHFFSNNTIRVNKITGERQYIKNDSWMNFIQLKRAKLKKDFYDNMVDDEFKALPIKKQKHIFENYIKENLYQQD